MIQLHVDGHDLDAPFTCIVSCFCCCTYTYTWTTLPTLPIYPSFMNMLRVVVWLCGCLNFLHAFQLLTSQWPATTRWVDLHICQCPELLCERLFDTCQQSANEWNRILGNSLHLRIFPYRHRHASPPPTNMNCIVALRQFEDPRLVHLAYTNITHLEPPTIRRVDILLDLQRIGSWEKVGSVMLHELGHVNGLDHHLDYTYLRSRDQEVPAMLGGPQLQVDDILGVLYRSKWI